MALIAPSLLSADFMNLERDCNMLNESLADWFHLDIMDGSFVPNISFGFPVLEGICKSTQKVCDVHLMIQNPGIYAEQFQKAGADVLTVHIEACPHLHRNLQQIKALGMKAGIALNPHTPIHLLESIIAEADLICLMSVNPGFGGQQFIPQTIQKIRDLKNLINNKGLSTLIEIDGGVTLANAGSLIAAGADVLVAGNTVFKSANPIQTIAELKKI